MLKDFLSLLFPPLCPACEENVLPNKEVKICVPCLMELPVLDWDDFESNINIVTKKFHGKVNIAHGIAYYSYSKNARIQRLMHKIKYKEGQELGYLLGKLLGSQLSLTTWYSDIDLVIPVPLHPKKMRIRGFNQAERIAKGTSQIIHKPLIDTVLERSIFTESQTKKSRLQRWKNVQQVFSVKELNKSKLEGKHVLFVDDIITTGATMESGVAALLDAGCAKVSIATLALAD